MSQRIVLIACTVGMASCAASQPLPPKHDDPGSSRVDRRAQDHHFAEPEKFAQDWNDPARDAWQKPGEIVAALDLQEGDTVADLGAGTGYLIEHLRSAVGETGRVLALDVEPAMIDFLRQRGAQDGWTNVTAIQSAHADPKLEAASVAAVVTLNTWHHIEEREAFARKLHRSLEAGGRFVIVDFLPEPTEGRGPPLEMRLAAESVVRELERAGFQTEIAKETLPRHYVVVATKGD